MDRFHFSTCECFENCPYRFELRYKKNLNSLPTDDPANPLILGTAIHRGMEKDMETAIQEYKDSYPIITDAHINEIIKLEYWIPKMKELLPEGFHEVNFKNDVYEGTADLIVPCTKHDQVFHMVSLICMISSIQITLTTICSQDSCMYTNISLKE